MKILVVDDDPGLRELVTLALTRDGFSVVSAANGQHALTHASREAPDLIVLDVGLPELDGFEVCRRIRASSDVPILFLTARDDEIDRIVGLELGADDYVTKPFSPRELVARVRTILKRTHGGQNGARPLKHGGLELDPNGHRCHVQGVEISLTGTEFTLLRDLIAAPDQIRPRHHLIERIWGAGSQVSDRTLDSHLRNLRRKLGEAGLAEAIETVHGVGIRLGKVTGVTGKWRPSLWVVLGGALGATLALSLAGLVILRYVGPEIGFRSGAVLVALGIGILTAGLGWLLLRLLLRPLAALDDYARAVRAHPSDIIAAPRHFGTREINSLAQSVIDMAATLRNRESTVRSYTNHVTHELKTPVSTLRAASELLSDSPELSQAEGRLLAQIDRATAQLEGQLQALRDVAMAQEADHRGQANLSDVIAALADDVPGLTVEVTPNVVVPLSMQGASIVMRHLLQNAVDHGAGKVVVSEDRGALIVQDDGPGISAGNRARIFDPFFTTRRETGGTGMGLWIAATLLRARGGDITLEHGSAGARFRLQFVGSQADGHGMS